MHTQINQMCQVNYKILFLFLGTSWRCCAGNALVMHGNLSTTKDVSWFLHSHLLPYGKPNFADQAFVYLDLYFVQAHNFRCEEDKSGSQFVSVQTTGSSYLSHDQLNIHWIAWEVGRLESGWDFWNKHTTRRMCCSTKPSFWEWCLSSPSSIDDTLPPPA